MKKNKFEISVLVGLIVFSLIIYGFYLVYNLYLNSKSYTLFLKPYGVLECKKWKCDEVSNKLSNYNNKEYNIVVDGDNIGKYDLYYNDVTRKYYVFNKNNDNVYDNGNLFGYNGKANISGVKYSNNSLTTREINDLKSKNKIDFDNMDALYTEKVVLDFDNDGKSESIYIMSSGTDSPGASLYFDYVLYEDNGKFYKIIGNTSENSELESIGHSSIASIMDIFNDGKLELVLNTEYLITGKTCSVLYRLKGKNFVAVNKCDM